VPGVRPDLNTDTKEYRVLWALLALFCCLVFLTQWITKHIQGIGILLTRDGQIALIVYFCLILPGVVIHEVSHALAARLLGVKVAKFSIGIKRKASGNSVSLGSVEIGPSGPFRTSLIGLAPLVVGTAVVLLIGSGVFGLQAFTDFSMDRLWTEAQSIYATPDFWIWFYLVFAVSNAMLPSAADRQAWATVMAFLAILVVVFYLTGLSDHLLADARLSARLAAWGRGAAGNLAWVFGLTVVVDLIIAAFLFLIEQSLGLLGFGRVQYRQ
jgi:hypothetical protein